MGCDDINIRYAQEQAKKEKLKAHVERQRLWKQMRQACQESGMKPPTLEEIQWGEKVMEVQEEIHREYHRETGPDEPEDPDLLTTIRLDPR